MKNHETTLKNHGNQPKTMKNHETTLKNHGNQPKIVGQFGTKIIKQTIWHQDNKSGQFGTRTIWHQDNLAPDNLAP